MNKIQIFNELNTSDDLLFLGNAWDLLSALTLEKVGFKAIGTTSWGIANSIGLADGELIDFDRHLRIIQSIAENVNIPVSADIEAGYSEDIKTIVYNVLRTANVGVAGINIEDSFKSHKGLKSISQHSKLISEIRTALDNNGFKDFYINARIDTYFQLEHPLIETLNRAKAYVESGTSGIFVPGLKNEHEIKEIILHVDAPLNILSLPGLTNCNKLKELGVKRFSFGNGLSDKIISYLEKTVEQLIEGKDTSILYEA
ncbi:isocitrate lyase/PEP mutase family protein [Gottfriedia solisilvae]|uniref:Carboxyvinyl-carboxyphosphonate phosphorylmutase n=1 Tax=Gottfriedia solisilvae TaxID=1516104 RepID=A0A8J3ASB7_9BACI|nr:isocitrate lyase/phosphoenolpyruvate mutase family protein [Gottfriedia solisilvae]GGI15731.1 carboxyvinyl-carboxyphosphonate phosphorylmutase [Gottfriedia solisilvae]